MGVELVAIKQTHACYIYANIVKSFDPVDRTHLRSVRLHGLLSQVGQFVPVQLSRPRIVLLLGIRRIAVVLAEELCSIGIAAQLHIAELQPGPVRVQVRRAHERYVDTEVAVHCRAVDANEHAVRYAGPRRILGPTVEACLEAIRGQIRRNSQEFVEIIQLFANELAIHGRFTLFVGTARRRWNRASISVFVGLLPAIVHELQRIK